MIVYDVTDPHAPAFVDYVNPDPTVDQAPEGIHFISAADSPTAQPLLVVTNEVSGTTAIFRIELA